MNKHILDTQRFNLGKMKLPKDIINIYKLFKDNHKDLYVVGGSVRDFLKNEIPHDIDLVTNALPNEIINILQKYYNLDLQGKQFGVVRVFTHDIPSGIEIATFRIDLVNGRDNKSEEEKVSFIDANIITDSERRDISINSLYYDIDSNEVIDLVGGIDDLNNNIIRAVGSPSKRFEEDRLRICRVLRFAARMSAKIEIETSNAIRNDNRLKGLNDKEDVSQERIFDEIFKSYHQVPNYNTYLELLDEYDMWPQIFHKSYKINKNKVDSEDFVILLANLFIYDVTDDLGRKLIQLYKIPSEISNKVIFLLNLFKFSSHEVLYFYKKKLQYKISNDMISEWIKVQKLNIDYLDKFVNYSPSVSSFDLINKGYSGKKLGDKIKELEYFNFIK
jgi:tRNA nucleotidyltransferase/poly(A) polymerase